MLSHLFCSYVEVDTLSQVKTEKDLIFVWAFLLPPIIRSDFWSSSDDIRLILMTFLPRLFWHLETHYNHGPCYNQVIVLKIKTFPWIFWKLPSHTLLEVSIAYLEVTVLERMMWGNGWVDILSMTWVWKGERYIYMYVTSFLLCLNGYVYLAEDLVGSSVMSYILVYLEKSKSKCGFVGL